MPFGWEQQCTDLLEILNQSKDSEPFREPISLSDYRQIIDHPMDLHTIREKLLASNYATPSDFSKDVRLIFENSTIYDTDKEWNTMTIRLGFLFEYNFRNILSSYGYRKKAAYRSKSEQVDDTSSVF